MFRSQTPKHQVALIETFIAEQTNTKVPHSQVLELVANINGAPNWNKFTGATKDSETAIVVKELLKTLAGPVKEENFVRSLSASKHSLNQVLLESVFQTALATSQTSAPKALQAACRQLAQLRETSKHLEDLIWKQMGFNREAKISDTAVPLELSTLMFDDETLYQLVVPQDILEEFGLTSADEPIDIPESLMDELRAEGVGERLFVSYPRADKYGIPHESTFTGGQEWLWNEGFAVSSDLVVDGEDGRDDSMATCEVLLYIEPELLKKLVAAVQQ